MIKIQITNRDTGETREIESEKDSLLIGRMPECDIFLDSATVSRKHAEITRIRGHYHVVDLESGNGTFHKGLRLKPFEKQPLADGDSVRIENFELVPHMDSSKDFKEEQTDSGIIEIKMIKKVLSALDSEKSPSIEGLSAPIKGKKVFFTDSLPELVIGRDNACDLSIDSTVISRRHAVIQKKWGGITISDLKSKNGTFINGERVSEKELHDGDKITLGDIELLFKNPHEIDLDALAKEYEAKEIEQAPLPPSPDEIATGFIDANTGEDVKNRETSEEDAAPAVSDRAKMSLGDEPRNLPEDSTASDSKSKPDDEDFMNGLGDEPEESPLPPAKKISWDRERIQFWLKKGQEYLHKGLNVLKEQLKDFSTLEKALLAVILLILLLSLIAFILIFT